VNVPGLTPEAKPIVQEAAAVYLKHTDPWFVGLVVYGSAVKGGFIPGCSDIDLQLYLAFSPNIKERRDFSCAVFDSSGNMIAQAAHIPVHPGSMPLSVLSAIQSPRTRGSDIEDGDAAAFSDIFLLTMNRVIHRSCVRTRSGWE